MTGDGKILKLACLAELFVGLVALAYGIVILVGNFSDADAWLTTAEGLVALCLGVHTARLANVPSNTSKIRTIVLVGALLALAVAALVIYLGDATTVIQDVLAVTVFVGLTIALVFSRKIVADQLRR